MKMNEQVSEADVPEVLVRLSAEMELELERILLFWSTRAVDQLHGGFLGQITGQGIPNPKASKGAVLNSRILWAFSAAYGKTGNPVYKDMATRAYTYLISHFWDERNGGIIWECNYLGKPLNVRKQAYAQGFAIYGLTEYFRVTREKESIAYAADLATILETKFRDSRHGGYFEALSADWHPMEDVRLSTKDLNSPKSMNTHLHILESYTTLYELWTDDKLKCALTDLIRLFQCKIMNWETGHFNLFFDRNWLVCSSLISYGHDIEGAWLLRKAAVIVDDQKLSAVTGEMACILAAATLKEGLAADGSLWYELDQTHLVRDHHWWVQAEALVGFFDAWTAENKSSYLRTVLKSWTYIKEHLIDSENGEWYWSIRDGDGPNLNEDKAGFWKCPYHNSRALMELMKRITQLSELTNE